MKPRNYWTKERVFDAAKGCKSRKEFRDTNYPAYIAATRYGWYHEIFASIPKLSTEANYWTPVRIREEAAKYTTRSEFASHCRPAYNAAKRLGLFDEVCAHMYRAGHTYLRCVYEIVNHSRRIAYVGLTSNIKKREHAHKCNKKMQQRFNGEVPNLQIIVDFCPVKDAVAQEKFWIQHYKIMGYELINSLPAGGLGGNVVKWTEDNLFKEARKYPTKVAFQRGNASAYAKAQLHPRYEEMCSHMKAMRIPDHYWDVDKCVAEFLKFGNKRDFRKLSSSAYNWACRNGKLKEVYEKAAGDVI